MPDTYGAKDISISFLDNLISGVADDSFVTVTMNTDAFSLEMGAQGDGVRVRSEDESGKIKIVLLQTSASNDVLAAALAADRAAGTGIGPFFLKDTGGRTFVHCNGAWVTKSADCEYGKGLSGREWTLESDKVEIFVAGSAG